MKTARATATKYCATTYAWRRLHGGNVIAEVAVVPGMGSWRIAAYRVTGENRDVAYIGKSFSLLTEAYSAADELVCSQFGHVCETGVCGRWIRWQQDSETA